MEILWKKEKNQPQTLYIDLFTLLPKEDQQSSIKLCQHQKNNQRSTELRNIGNEHFLSGNLYDAMRYYNHSCCFAEIGSENVALVYINRSACFSRLQMHNKAFVDIKLAKSANVPDRLHLKLEKCEIECQKRIDSTEKCSYYSPSLSYEADKKFSCMANVLKIVQNDVFGRHLIATCDIPVGKIVLIEESFIACTINGHEMCYTCYREMENFIACPNCPNVLFCNIECMNRNAIHKWECGTFTTTNHIETKLTINAILMAIETFSNVDSLMKFVENVLSEDTDKLPSNVNDAKSMFHFYFKLTKIAKYQDQILFNINNVYNSILGIRKIADLFNTEEKLRFLMHLIAHIYLINRANAIGSEIIRRVINVFSMINHSCAPNLYTRYAGNLNYCVTIRPVKKGDQLFINYLGSQNQTLNERCVELKSKWNFVCNCEKCKSNNKSIDHKQLLSDPNYEYVTKNYHKMDKPVIILEKCEDFLNKYAYAMWSKEIETVSEIYRSALILEHFKNLYI